MAEIIKLLLFLLMFPEYSVILWLPLTLILWQ